MSESGEMQDVSDDCIEVPVSNPVIELDDSSNSSSASSEEIQIEDNEKIDLNENKDCIQVIENEQSQDEKDISQDEKDIIQDEKDISQEDQSEIDVVEIDNNQTECDTSTTEALNVIDENQDYIRAGPSQSEENQEKSNPCTSTNNPTTLFRIIFSDEQKYFELKEQITNVLGLCLKENHLDVDFIEDKNFLDICAVENTTITENAQTSSTNMDVVDVDDSIDLCFEIDTIPQNVDKRTIPSYKRSIKEVLNENVKRPKLDTEECPRPRANSCFNCLGNHAMKDCPLPKNQQRIKKNRQTFASRHDRYHKNSMQMFPHLKPGKYSEKLKRALGLRNGEIPSFIYKMRLFGYPPGWLEEAKIPHSGLALFDSEGRKVLSSDEEDGEVDVIKYKYDIEKIIDFPGYNVDVGPHFFDNHKYFGVPPMLAKFRKEEFIKSLGDENILKGYKRKKLKDISANVTASENTPEDMEIDNVQIETSPVMAFLHPPPPPPPQQLPPPPPPPYEEPLELEPGECEEDARNSPSLAELVERKKQLLEALQNSSVSAANETSLLSNLDNSENLNEITIDETISKNMNESQECSKNNEIQNEIDLNSSENNQSVKNLSTNNDKISTPIQNSTKLMLGTPVLKFSPYDKLPSGEKFSVGVSDVINFENLADSTGKYEQMKKVLQKVRNVVTQLNMDD